MMQSLFSVPVIMGEISNMPDQKFIQDAMNGPSLFSGDTDNGLDHADPKDRKIPKEKIAGLIEEMTKQLIDCGESVKYESHWIHVHHKNMSTNTHGHLPCSWSSACYLQTPKNSGKICFIVEELGLQASITPEEGKYIIFPSRLKHFVTAHGNDTPRVSLSVNWK